MAPRDEWTAEERNWDYFRDGFKHEYSPRHLFGQDGCDFQERVNWARMRQYRLGRLQWAIRKNGLRALLLNVGNNIRYANGTWDYDWKGNDGSRYVLVFCDAEPFFFDTIGMDMEVTRMNCPWIEEDRLDAAIPYPYALGDFEAECRRYWDQIKAVCQANGVDVTRERLGIDTIDIAAYEIGKGMGIKIVPAGQVIDEARRIKNQDELECLKIAAAIGDMGYWKAKYEIAKPGVRERDVLGKVVEFMYGCGAQHCWGTNVASGGNSNPYLRAFTDKLIRQGDMITLDLNTNHYYGYVQDTCRSWVVGRKMTTKQKDVYRRCYDLLQESLSVIKPGATTADVARKWPRYYDNTRRTATFVQCGHAIGCGYEGFTINPAFSIKHPVELEANMCLAVETYASDGPGGDCGVRLEDNLVVTDTGYSLLSLFPFEEEAVGFVEN